MSKRKSKAPWFDAHGWGWTLCSLLKNKNILLWLHVAVDFESGIKISVRSP